MKKVKIIIADDHTLFIDGLRQLLKDESWIEITDIAVDGRELMRILPHSDADLVLLDINMPQLNGLDAARHIKVAYPVIKLIILSTYSEDHLIDRARHIGVNGYLLKNCNKNELLETISQVMSNQSCFPYRQPDDQVLAEGDDAFLRQFNLTRREVEIIQLLKNGATNKQIADQLFLSIYTVETHRKNIMRKLELNSPASLMKFIFQKGI